MKVYFACASAGVEKYRNVYLRMIDTIERLGHVISVDWIKRFLVEEVNTPPDYWEEKELIQREGIIAIQRSDILIADVSLPSSSVGYQVAIALSEKKPEHVLN